jgi:hypothetical protein
MTGKVSNPTIFTIGYSALRPVRLFEIATQLRATVIDCRYKPYSRIPGFDMPMLKVLFNGQYEWHGYQLGGFGHTTSEGIAFLRKQRRNVLLMCMEEAPGECHRHRDICAPYFPAALHIFKDEMIKCVELERALTLDEDYPIAARLSQYKVL